jgi:hypothetical protein
MTIIYEKVSSFDKRGVILILINSISGSASAQALPQFSSASPGKSVAIVTVVTPLQWFEQA